ncbi:putative two-component [Nocardioides sp. CF8]|uniref:MadS family sensor histidine kinase n=1 Tax=Nocardioides sp. CF8 TaxID=110319 RepID=UPI00032E5897|nr:histidine kinase [Nocardioides sp. CF8]EON22003.1 putative two-component [Nocardioides sp. CF8]
MTTRPQSPPPDLATLTGVRSGKDSYYRAYVRSDERMQRAVRAMDSISHAVVRTLEGPRGLLEEVVRAAAAHLEAEWTILALSDGHLRGARPRFLVLGPADGAHCQPTADDDDLPATVRRELGAIRAGHALRSNDDNPWVRVPMTLEGRPIGCLVGLHQLEIDPVPGDLSVLRILANQAAVLLHTSEQYQAGMALHRRGQLLRDEARAHERDLEVRTSELRRVEDRLVLARQRELIDTERHRIARELHDSVAQYVLSAGMAVEVAREEAEQLGQEGAGISSRLGTAKDLSQQAVDQLRRAIYALHRTPSDTVVSLPELLREVAAHHRPQLVVQVRIEGEATPLPVDAGHEITRAVGEAMFNVAAHARAERAVVRLRYRPDLLLVTVADDGHGDPRELSRLLRLERGRPSDGFHRGLANIESRLVELGGSLAFRRARIGGVRVEMRIPLPLTPLDRPDIIDHLVATWGPAAGRLTDNRTKDGS